MYSVASYGKVYGKKPKVYLDTSVPSAYYDERNPERATQTRAFGKRITSYEVIISAIVESELIVLRMIDTERAEKTINLVASFFSAAFTAEADALSQVNIQEKAFREGADRAARQTVVATVEQARYLVSWNFRDLVNIKARARINTVNIEQGYATLRFQF